MKYLIRVKIQDGENRYWEQYVHEAKSEKEALKYAYKDAKDCASFVRLFEVVDAQLITDTEEKILEKFGLI